MSIPRKLTWIAPLVSIALAVCAEDDPLDLRADRLLEAFGSKKGVCCVVHCGDGAFAAALARRSCLFVLAVDERPAQVEQARETARKTGLLGARLFVDAGSSGKIPLTQDYADLLVHDGLDDAALAALAPAEIVRVLSPRFGQAMLGRSAGAEGTGKLTREALADWIKQAGIEGSVREDATGLWAVLKKPAKKGADNWSYWNHGPDNNPSSLDTAYGVPEQLQWLGRPFQTGLSVLYLAAGGRVFIAYSGDRFSGTSGWPRFGPEEALEVQEHTLHVFQGYNGRLLWSRPMPEHAWYGYSAYGYSTWIATDDRFFLAELGDVVELDAANGKELHRFKTVDDTGMIYWLAVQDGRAWVLTGERGKMSAHCTGKRLAAYDLKTGTLAWEHLEKNGIDAHAVSISDGRLFFFAGDTRAAALEAGTGKELWSNEKMEGPKDRPSTWSPPFTYILSNPDFVGIMNSRRGMLVLATKDGHELWRRPPERISNVLSMIEMDGRMLTNAFPRINNLDLDNGEVAATKENFGFSGCGRLISVPGCTIGQFGTVYDLEKKKIVTRPYMKPACSVGNIVANGMRYSAPHWCRCLMPFRGLLGWNRKPEAPPPAPEFPLDRFDPAEPPALEADPNDWTQYRRDGAHSGASPAATGTDAPKQRWLYRPPAPSLPTPALSVNGNVFYGAADGTLRCIDSESGKVRWECVTAGKIYVPPTFAENRVLAGSADGRIYACSAATGKLLWRFRAAPADQRVNVYDNLISRWPVNSNLEVDHGTVFGTAGLIDLDGVYVHALDLRTGAAKWTNDALGKPGTNAKAVPLGAMAIAGGRLWLRCDSGHPSFDLQTGALAELPKEGDNPDADPPDRERAGMGKDLGLFAGKYLIDGGRRLFSEQCDRVQTRCDAFAQEIGKDGAALYPRYMLAERGASMPLMPAWDEGLIVYVLHSQLTAVRPADLLKSFEDAKKLDKGVLPVSQKPPMVQWTFPHPYGNALALSKDAVLFAEGVADEKNPGLSNHKTRFSAWQLCALNRATGRDLWRVTLPSEPIFDGISIGRDGSILVACADGTIVCYGGK